MLASWLNTANIPYDYSIIKNENAINLAFSNNNGIYQKLYINNKLYGYFAAINIDDSYVFTYFQPLIKNISTKNIKLFLKHFCLTKIKRIKNNLSNLSNTSFFDYFSEKILKNNKNNYINKCILDQALEFDNRLQRYYKNKVVLTYIKNLNEKEIKND